jgi:hypothetical protein
MYGPAMTGVRRWIVAACFTLLASCATASMARSVAATVHEHEAHCARATMDKYSPYRMPLADPVTSSEDMAWLAPLPPEARRTARAAGLEPLLVALLRASAAERGEGTQDSAEPTARPNVPASTLYQELTLRLLAFDAQLSALAFETQCTRQRVAQLIDELDSQENKRQLGLATGSLITGAGTGIAAGAVDLASVSERLPIYIALFGGVVTAALGAASLMVPERPIGLEHRRNMLRPIFRGEDPEHLYPSFVFRMLTAKYEGDATTPRDSMLADFESAIEEHVDARAIPESIEVMFGDGGVYPRELLEARVDLLHILESSVHGVARDVELFHRSLVKLLAPPR